MTQQAYAFLMESACINVGVALIGEVSKGESPALAEATLAHAAWTVLQTADMAVHTLILRFVLAAYLCLCPRSVFVRSTKWEMCVSF